MIKQPFIAKIFFALFIRKGVGDFYKTLYGISLKYIFVGQCFLQ